MLCSDQTKDMKRTLEVLNEIVHVGLIESYAIGGAMAAAFYTEPLDRYHLERNWLP